MNESPPTPIVAFPGEPGAFVHGRQPQIRYAQCWEDADILVDALALQPGHTALSIASAGDNTLALLTRPVQQVIALDLNPAQLACLELRVAAYRELGHAALLELIGSRPSRRRPELYLRCRPLLSHSTREFWDRRADDLTRGIGSAGKFERYFRLFRHGVLPLVHSHRTVMRLLESRPPEQREDFHRRIWDTCRWRLLFRIFFSRRVMGRLGRDPSFFRYVETPVAERILERARYALTALDPSANPYLHWILTGTHGDALPLALRPEHFETIRANLDRLEWHNLSVAQFLHSRRDVRLDGANLSDIFEYLSEPDYHHLLDRLCRASRPGARLVYWNMLAPRTRPESMANRLRPLTELSRDLFSRDQAFFYSAFVIEEVV